MKRAFGIMALLSMVVLLAGTVLACGKSTTTTTSVTTTAPKTTTAKAVDPVKIGLTDAGTGTYAVSGSSFMAGAKYAIQVINDAGGIKSLGGAKLVGALGPSDSTAPTVASEVERLITGEKVVAIIGPTSTVEALAAVPVCEKYHVPSINIVNDVTNFQKGYRYFFSVAPTSVVQGEGLADFVAYLAKDFGAPTDKIAVLHEDPSMASMSTIAENKFTSYGFKFTDYGFNTAGTTDQGPLVLKLKAAGVSLILYNGGPATGPLMNKAMFQYDYYPWFIGSAQVTGATSAKNALSPDVAKAVLTHPKMFSAGYFQYGDVYGKVASLKAFQDGFQKANPGNTLDPVYVAVGAQRVFLLAQALEDSASRNPEEIANALRKVDMKAPNPNLVFADVYPEMKMSDNGSVATASISAVQWLDDLSGTQTIWPPAIASASPRVK